MLLSVYDHRPSFSPCSSPSPLYQNCPYGRLQRRVLKIVSSGNRLSVTDPLPRRHQRTRLTQRHVQRQARHRQPGWAMEYLTKGLAEFVHRHRLRRHGIERTGQRGGPEHPLNQADLVSPVNPGDLLGSRQNRPPSGTAGMATTSSATRRRPVPSPARFAERPPACQTRRPFGPPLPTQGNGRREPSDRGPSAIGAPARLMMASAPSSTCCHDPASCPSHSTTVTTRPNNRWVLPAFSSGACPCGLPDKVTDTKASR